MDKKEYLEFSARDFQKIHEVENEIKETKLRSFYIELLANNELDDIHDLINKKIQFYEELNATLILEKAIEDISNSLFRDLAKEAIHNIRNINEEKHLYIKNILVEKIVKNIKEIEKQEFTEVQLQFSPFHKKTLEIGLELLLESPNFIDLFKTIEIKEYKKIIEKIELNEKLNDKFPIKKQTEIKHKI